ncbi:MAG: glycosyltransferase family 4 protein [Acidobacteria bacterium]|nr:glycosyltransferase family 4 protein [Acidobacteriota bacterium]
MRILFLNTSFPPMARSAAHLFHNLGCNLVSFGNTVSVVTELPWRRLGSAECADKYRNARFWLPEKMNGMNVIRVRGFPFREGGLIGRGVNALLLPLTFYLGARSMGEHDVALVYCPPVTLGLAAFLIKQLHRMPFVFNVQDIYPQTLIDLGLMKNRLLIRFFEWVERFSYSRAAAIVVHSEGNRQYLIHRRGVSAEKVEVIPNWVDIDLFRQSDPENGFREKHGLGSKFLVCYAGTMGYAQDLGPIIQAAKELQEIDDIRFLLIGEGVRAIEWRRMAERLCLDNVQFLPLQPPSVYPSIVAACDVGMVPLTTQLRTPVVPGKLLDFMGARRPVIATVNADGDTSQIIREANCGYAFSPDDGHSVAAAILTLYRNPTIAHELGQNGGTYAESHFSLSVCAAKYEALFKRIISS